MTPDILERFEALELQHIAAMESLSGAQWTAVRRLLLASALVPDDQRASPVGRHWVLGILLEEAKTGNRCELPTIWADLEGAVTVQ